MTRAQRMTVLYHDDLLPAYQGGKADLWRRLVALKQAGWAIQLIYWGRKEENRAEDDEILSGVVDEVLTFKRKPVNFLSALINLEPAWISKFRLDSKETETLNSACRKFKPDVVWAEGPWVAKHAIQVANLIQIPVLYRSQNIEHQYMKGQAAVTKGLIQRWRRYAVFLGLKRHEFSVMKQSKHIFDISENDIRWWNSAGIQHNSLLLPISEYAIKDFQKSSESGKRFDVVFLGNLNSPNNCNGVIWLLKEVWPEVLKTLPDTRLTIVGSGENSQVSSNIKASKNVDRLSNVDDILPILHSARLLVNPVLTGGGVQLKMIEMLMTDAPIVSTAQGVSGLPKWVQEEVCIAVHPSEFAEGIVSHLKGKNSTGLDRQKCHELFSVSAVAKISEVI